MSLSIRKVITTIFALLMLGFVIIFHEMGHFFTCKLFNVATPVFSVGFGPALIHRTIGQTRFQLALLPLGGYVSINNKDLDTKPYWQKMVITLAGIFNNIILSLFLIIILFLINRSIIVPVIGDITSGSPADKAGLQRNDKISMVNHIPLHNTMTLLMQIIQSSPHKNITLSITRNNTPLEKVVHLERTIFMGTSVGYLGATFCTDTTHTKSFGTSIMEALQTTKALIYEYIFLLIGLFKSTSPKQIKGPLGILALTSQSLSQGLSFFLFFIASISIQLGIFNLIPIPLLDGGQAFEYTLQAATGNMLSFEDVALIHYSILILCILFIIYINRKPRTT